MPTNIKDWVDQTAPFAWLWAMWWVVMYLNEVRKWKPFKIWSFILNIVIAWIIWFFAKDFIPSNMWDIKYSLVGIVWFLSFPILDWLEKDWLTLLINKFIWKQK